MGPSLEIRKLLRIIKTREDDGLDQIYGNGSGAKWRDCGYMLKSLLRAFVNVFGM